VHFLDVGQGDATLFVTDDASLLVDTGRHDRDDVVEELRHLGVDRIDMVAITHPHADHIGQLDRVIATVAVGEVWMSGSVATTATFSRAMDAVESRDIGYEEPRAGDSATFGSLHVEVLHPSELVDDIHGDTLVLRVTHGAMRFLFTGDAEGPVESTVTSTADVRAEVYQVGHHGSTTSSTPDFLEAVDPVVAVYSAGSGNPYGHPDPGVLSRLADMGVQVYGTDTHGTVTITSDGRSIEVATGAAPTRAPPNDPPQVAAASNPTGCGVGQVDINHASETELTRIVHIGSARAADIVRLRTFAAVDDLRRVRGISAARVVDITREGLACVGERP
jgi:competence protein ComEC